MKTIIYLTHTLVLITALIGVTFGETTEKPAPVTATANTLPAARDRGRSLDLSDRGGLWIQVCKQ